MSWSHPSCASTYLSSAAMKCAFALGEEMFGMWRAILAMHGWYQSGEVITSVLSS